jgi:hypothetical protein
MSDERLELSENETDSHLNTGQTWLSRRKTLQLSVASGLGLLGSGVAAGAGGTRMSARTDDETADGGAAGATKTQSGTQIYAPEVESKYEGEANVRAQLYELSEDLNYRVKFRWARQEALTWNTKTEEISSSSSSVSTKLKKLYPDRTYEWEAILESKEGEFGNWSTVGQTETAEFVSAGQPKGQINSPGQIDVTGTEAIFQVDVDNLNENYLYQVSFAHTQNGDVPDSFNERRELDPKADSSVHATVGDPTLASETTYKWRARLEYKEESYLDWKPTAITDVQEFNTEKPTEIDTATAKKDDNGNWVLETTVQNLQSADNDGVKRYYRVYFYYWKSDSGRADGESVKKGWEEPPLTEIPSGFSTTLSNLESGATYEWDVILEDTAHLAGQEFSERDNATVLDTQDGGTFTTDGDDDDNSSPGFTLPAVAAGLGGATLLKRLRGESSA